MPEQKVNFLVIGAAKAGTTSLFKYLTAHPQIYMPPQKETKFFSDDYRYSKGMEWYLKNCFSGISPERVKGEASPQYMMFDSVPERISKEIPHVKIIALLRNPIDRAYSHYMHAVRERNESRDFLSAIQQQVERGPLPCMADYDHKIEHTALGEYGRILGRYYELFPRENILVIFSEDLSSRTAETMELIYRFLSVDPGFTSEEFQTRHNVLGETRFPLLTKIKTWLAGTKGLKKLIITLVPPRILDTIDIWFTTHLNIKRKETEGVPEDAQKLLGEYYREDVLMLEELIGRSVPWEDFRGSHE